MKSTRTSIVFAGIMLFSLAATSAAEAAPLVRGRVSGYNPSTNNYGRVSGGYNSATGGRYVRTRGYNASTGTYQRNNSAYNPSTGKGYNTSAQYVPGSGVTRQVNTLQNGSYTCSDRACSPD
jgi:hypothetical protein